MTEKEPNDLVTITEIVEKYGIARKTVQRWVDAEKLLPALTLPGRTGAHLFTPEAAEAAFGGHLRKRQAEAKKLAEEPTE